MDTNHPILLSVVIPAYNAGEYLEDTVNSVLQDTFSSFEIIIVDDGSRDNTAMLADSFATSNPKVRVFHLTNSGVCKARNYGIQNARGKYILPVDADDLLLPGFMEWAVGIMEKRAEVKCCIPKAVFMGERSGAWRLKPYKRSLIARKNMIPATALYRKEDWVRVGGYCEKMQAREDWDFWISVLKNGGEVVTSEEVFLKYRIHNHSKRIADRTHKRKVIDTLNERHPAFFQNTLGGPLRYHRSWSRVINAMSNLFRYKHLTIAEEFAYCKDFILAMPFIYKGERGEIIYNRRNQLRRMEYEGAVLVVKSYHRPHLINQIVYGILRPTKAKRAYEYALLLKEKGIGVPSPVAYYTERFLGIFLTKSYFVSLNSTLPYTYNDIIANRLVEDEVDYLTAIAKTTAQLHNLGMVHMDYSRGNILLGKTESGEVRIELIDLNRLRFHAVDIHEGCKNFSERLPANEKQRRIMAEVYAQERHFDAALCYQLMIKYNKEKK